MAEYPEEFLELCRSVTAKRPKIVIDHILKYGSITTDDLKEKYGYEHAPRAVRDVKEHGIPIKKTMVPAPNGRRMAKYEFGDPSAVRFKRFDGRTALAKDLKQQLIKKYGCKCFIYLEEMDERDLQIDHRVPYEVGGDQEGGTLNPDEFMLLCGSANRAKSWSCEHCENWAKKKDKKICLSCYWAYPEGYSHVATRQIRRLDLIWDGDDIAEYERLKEDAAVYGASLPEFVKEIIRKQLGN